MNTQETIKSEIDQVILHKITGALGKADMCVTEALIKHLRKLQERHLVDQIITKEITNGN